MKFDADRKILNLCQSLKNRCICYDQVNRYEGTLKFRKIKSANYLRRRRKEFLIIIPIDHHFIQVMTIDFINIIYYMAHYIKLLHYSTLSYYIVLYVLYNILYIMYYVIQYISERE